MTKSLPTIGIFGWKTGDNSYGTTVPYLTFIANYGIARILTPEEPVDPNLDLIVVPGGPDVDPSRYGEIPNLWTGKPDPIREYFDTRILPQYIERGVPVFGIN